MSLKKKKKNHTIVFESHERMMKDEWTGRWTDRHVPETRLELTDFEFSGCG